MKEEKNSHTLFPFAEICEPMMKWRVGIEGIDHNIFGIFGVYPNKTELFTHCEFGHRYRFLVRDMNGTLIEGFEFTTMYEREITVKGKDVIIQLNIQFNQLEGVCLYMLIDFTPCGFAKINKIPHDMQFHWK